MKRGSILNKNVGVDVALILPAAGKPQNDFLTKKPHGLHKFDVTTMKNVFLFRFEMLLSRVHVSALTSQTHSVGCFYHEDLHHSTEGCVCVQVCARVIMVS